MNNYWVLFGLLALFQFGEAATITSEPGECEDFLLLGSYPPGWCEENKSKCGVSSEVDFRCAGTCGRCKACVDLKPTYCQTQYARSGEDGCLRYPYFGVKCPETCGFCKQGKLVCGNPFGQKACEYEKSTGRCDKPSIVLDFNQYRCADICKSVLHGTNCS